MEAGVAVETTAEDVLTMGVPQIISFATKHGIPLTGLATIDQWKQRILMYLRVMDGTQFDMEREFGQRHRVSSLETRQTLDHLMAELQAALSDVGPTVSGGLREAVEGGADPHTPLAQRIQAGRSALASSQCPFVVAGETNSGKSTFLNLLLGVPILPTWIFSCTAAACVLNYASEYSAEIHYDDGSRRQQGFSDAKEARTWLNAVVAEEDLEKREQGLGIDSIHVYLPAPILQSGMTLVDTPGIGENDVMTKCTMDYVRRNKAAAYIYIIKTDNAGGIHDDVLLEFLRAILEVRQSDAESFDPSSAIFVCNRWDEVAKNGEEAMRAMRENALTKLQDVWPGFQPKQAFFLSSKHAQMHADADPRYVAPDYEEVLLGIKELLASARHNIIHTSYSWLKQLLYQSSNFLQMTAHHCSQSDEELIATFTATKNKLTALQTQTTEKTQKLRELVEAEVLKLCDAMAAILKEEDVHNELMDWTSHPVPEAPEAGSVEMKRLSVVNNEADRWKEEVYTAIIRRIMVKVDEEIRKRGLEQELQMTLRLTVQQELKLVDEDINSIRRDLCDRTSINSSVSSTGSCMSTDSDEGYAVEMFKMYRGGRQDGSGFSVLRNVRRVNNSASASSSSGGGDSQLVLNSVRKVVMRRLMIPISSVMSAIRIRRRLSTWREDPTAYMQEKTAKFIKTVTDDRSLQLQMAAKYHEKLDGFISEVENSIPSFIASNRRLMDDIRVNRKKYLQQQRELVRLMVSLEPVREKLRGFGSLYVRDVTAGNVRFTLDEESRKQSVTVSVPVDAGGPHGDSGLDAQMGSLALSSRGSVRVPKSARTSRGLWSTWRWGEVNIGGQDQHLVGRCYIQDLPEGELIREIAKLRCLQSSLLAHFLGMTREHEGAVFLFIGDLLPARRFLNKCYHQPSQSVPALLEGVIKGLQYLHHQNLVHMELTLDTIMVNRQGSPKLCGACLPRTARFPPDADIVDCTPFVCLSPEVLRGALYVSEDDNYSFGLVVLETCLQEKPFEAQSRSLTLQDFRNQVHPSSMLDLESKAGQLSDNLSAILRGCLLLGRGLRTKTADLVDRVADLHTDPIITNLSTAAQRKRHKFVKHSSDDSQG